MNYIYCRISTDGQNETSLVVQEETVRKHIQAVSNDEITVVKEIGSGKNTEGRPKFLEILSKLENGDIIAVYDNSRLSRNTEVSLFLLREIAAKGAKLLCDGKFIDPDNPQDEMIYSIQSSFSTYQRQIQIKKSVEGLKKRYLNGDAVFVSSLFGYEIRKKGKTVTVTTIEEERRVIEHIFNEYSKGCSVGKLYKELHDTPTQRGLKIDKQLIRSVLKRPIYMGYYYSEPNKTRFSTNYSKEQLKKWLIKSNLYPAIVSEELWWRVYDSWRGYRRKGTVPFENRFTMHECSGIYHCSGCKGGINHDSSFSSRTGRQANRYTFQTHMADCTFEHRTPYDSDWLENITAICFYITFYYGDEVGVFFEEQRAKLYETTEELTRAIESIDDDIKKIDAKLGKIVDAIADDIIDLDVARKKTEELKQKKQGLLDRRKDIDADLSAKIYDAGDFVEDSVEEVLEHFNENRRANYLRFVKEGLNYRTYLTLEFVNGKRFKINRYKAHNFRISDVLVEVSMKDVFQFDFTYSHMNKSVHINVEPSEDEFKNYNYVLMKKLEDKLNAVIAEIHRN